MQVVKRLRMNGIVFLLVTLLLAASCATAGRNFPESAVKEIAIGTTTREEVRSIFGPPWRTGLEDGQETWTYGHYRYRPFQGSESSDLIVRFDDQGRVSSYSYSATNPELQE